MIFNYNNTEWKTGEGSLILGQKPALLDSINRKHKKLFELYKGQKSVDWSEDEIDLDSSRLDFARCPQEVYDGMISNLAFQWEADSIAANAMAVVLAPFITDSDFKLSVTKNSEIENLHALTYSEIVRLAIPEPQDVFKKIMENDKITERMSTLNGVLLSAQKKGSLYTIGQLNNDQDLYNTAFMALVSFYCLERLQFMASFAHTFAIVELGYFQGVGKLVQKIMQDEMYYHCRTMEYALKVEMETKRGMMAYMEKRNIIVDLVNEVLQREYDWNKHIFSTCSILGMNEGLMNSWVEWNAQEVYKLLMIDTPFVRHTKNPLPFMDDWLDIDSFQHANQEGDNNNYSLNSFIDDVGDETTYVHY